MREMKDSGIEWIGEIPKDWVITKLKYLGDYINGYAFKPEDWGSDGMPIVRIQDLTHSSENTNYFSGIIDEKYKVLKGDILVSWAATLDAYIWTGVAGWLNQHIFKAIPNTEIVNKGYFYWLLKETMANMNFDNKHGIVMQHVTLSVFDNYFVPMPKIEWHIRIADYLDKKCSCIDEVISKQKKIIEKLKEYRLSVITEAVTKGLNPNVEMKDSYTGWAGMIPLKWEACSIKRVTDFITCGVASTPDYADEEDGVLFLSAQNVKDGYMNFKVKKYITKELHEKLTRNRMPQKGDILQVRVGAGIGNVAIVEINSDFSVYVSLTHIRTNEKVINKYMMYCMLSTLFRAKEASYVDFAGSQGNLNVADLRMLKMPLPPIKEQQKIIDFIEKRENILKRFIEKKEELIKELICYKKSLIYEVVTGKKEV